MQVFFNRSNLSFNNRDWIRSTKSVKSTVTWSGMHVTNCYICKDKLILVEVLDLTQFLFEFQKSYAKLCRSNDFLTKPWTLDRKQKCHCRRSSGRVCVWNTTLISMRPLPQDKDIPPLFFWTAYAFRTPWLTAVRNTTIVIHKPFVLESRPM